MAVYDGAAQRRWEAATGVDVDVLTTLPARERAIVEMRYGLLDGRPRTLAAIGDEFDLSPERVRQLEKRAIRRAQHPSRRLMLEGLGDNHLRDRKAGDFDSWIEWP